MSRGPLLVRRSVIPTDALCAWVRVSGGPSSGEEWEAWDPHVTVIYSSAKDAPWPELDWKYSEFGGIYDSRSLERFGGGRLLVMTVNCPSMQARHQHIRALGHSFDYPQYTPHITLWNGARMSGGTPCVRHAFGGRVLLGPETAKVPRKFRPKEQR